MWQPRSLIFRLSLSFLRRPSEIWNGASILFAHPQSNIKIENRKPRVDGVDFAATCFFGDAENSAYEPFSNFHLPRRNLRARALRISGLRRLSVRPDARCLFCPLQRSATPTEYATFGPPCFRKNSIASPPWIPSGATRRALSRVQAIIDFIGAPPLGRYTYPSVHGNPAKQFLRRWAPSAGDSSPSITLARTTAPD